MPQDAFLAVIHALNKETSCKACTLIRKMRTVKNAKKRFAMLHEMVNEALKGDDDCVLCRYIMSNVDNIKNSIKVGKLIP